jgi:O-Antigen ligase
MRNGFCVYTKPLATNDEMNIYPTQIFLFLIGSLVFFRINLVGMLTWSEVITLGYFLIRWRNVVNWALQDNILRTILRAWLIYLLFQVCSDMVNGTLPSDFLRGWARLVFFAVNITVIAFLSGLQLDRMAAFFAGYAASLMLASFQERNEFLTEWKFGYGPAITMLAALFIGLLRSERVNRIGGIALVMLGLVHLQANARSLGGITLLIGILSILATYFKENLRNSGFFSIKFLLPIVVALIGIYQVYTIGASSGLLGEKSRDKYEKQTAGGRNILSGGRMEYTIAIPAILDAPVLGYGSWARHPEYVKKYIYINGIDPNTYDAEYLMELGTIPTHSHILGSWAEAGVAGGIFWILVLWLALRTFYRMLEHDRLPFRAFLLFMLVFFIWDILFSPFGLERRVTDPAMIMVIAAVQRLLDLQSSNIDITAMHNRKNIPAWIR